MAGKDVIMYFILGGVVGGALTFIGYDQISKILPKSGFAHRKGYTTSNHLNLYPFRPASLY